MALTVQERIQIELRAEFAGLRRDLAGAQRATRAATRDMSSGFADVGRSVAAASSAVTSLAAVVVGTYGLHAMREVGKTIDTWNLVENRIRLVVDTTEELKTKQAELFAISQEARVGYESTAALYTRIARNTKSLSIESDRLLVVTEAISKALVISGAGAQSADAALVQLTQGFAANALRGQELNSVMEQIPRVSEAIATGMGVSIGKLRSLAAEGKLTTEAVITALESQAAAINREFTSMNRTMGQAAVQLKNDWAKFLGELDKTLGITKAVTSLFDDLRKSFQDTDAEAKGLQNTWVDLGATVVVWTTYIVDNANLAWEALNEFFAKGIAGASYMFGFLIVQADRLGEAFINSLGYSIEAVKLSFMEMVNYLSGVEVLGVQVTPNLVSDEDLAKAKAELAVWETWEAESIAHRKAALKELDATYADSTKQLEANTKAALRTAMIGVDERRKILLKEAADNKIAEANKPFIKVASIKDKGITETERKNTEAILKLNADMNKSLYKQLETVAKIRAERNKALPELEREQSRLRAIVAIEEKRIEAATELANKYIALKANATDKQALTYQKEIEKLQEAILSSKLKIAKTESDWQVALGKAAVYESNISKELLGQVALRAEMAELQELSIFSDESNDLSTARLEASIAASRNLQQTYGGLEQTDALRMKILKEHTHELKLQKELVTEQRDAWEESATNVKNIAGSFLEAYATSHDIEDALAAAASSTLDSAKSGDYGSTGSWFGWIVTAIQGLWGTSSAEIEADRERLTGTVDFGDESLTALSEMYASAIYPLLDLTRRTNELLGAQDAISENIALSLATGSLGGNDHTFRTAGQAQYITDLTGIDYNNRSDSTLGGFTAFDEDIIASGFTIAAQSLTQAAEDAFVNGYQTIETESSGFWGVFSDTDVHRDLLTVSDALRKHTTEAYSNAKNLIQIAGEALGVNGQELQAALDAIQIEQIDVELLGLEPEEAQKQIQDALSSSLSAIVSELGVFNELVGEYATAAEKPLETLLRIALDYEQASRLLNDINIDPESGDKRDILDLTRDAGGLSELGSLTRAFQSDYFTPIEIQRKEQTYIASVFEGLDIAVPATKEAFKDLVQAQDHTTVEGRRLLLTLLRLAPAFAAANEAGEELGLSTFLGSDRTALNKHMADVGKDLGEALNTLQLDPVDFSSLQSNLQGSIDILTNFSTFNGELTPQETIGYDEEASTNWVVATAAPLQAAIKWEAAINEAGEVMESAVEEFGTTELDIAEYIDPQGFGLSRETDLKDLEGVEHLRLTGEETASEVRAAINDYTNEVYSALLMESEQIKSFVNEFSINAESAMETLIRVAQEFSIANRNLINLNQDSVSVMDTLSLVRITGGIDTFSALTTSFFKDYYSAQEMIDAQRGQLDTAFSSLGLQTPTSTRAYREQLEAINLTTESGKELYAELLLLSPLFTSMTQGEEALRKERERSQLEAERERERAEKERERAEKERIAAAKAARDGAFTTFDGSQRNLIVDYMREFEEDVNSAMDTLSMEPVDFSDINGYLDSSLAALSNQQYFTPEIQSASITAANAWGDSMSKIQAAMISQAAHGATELNPLEVEGLGGIVGIDSLRLKGDENASEIREAIAQYTEDVYSSLLLESATVNHFVKEFGTASESAVQTLMRIASEFQDASKQLEFLNQENISAFGTLSLVKETGGISAFTSLTNSFLKDFYEAKDVAAKQESHLRAQFASIGVAMPASIWAYKEYMEAIDLTSASGRELYATMLQLAPLYKEIDDVAVAHREAKEKAMDDNHKEAQKLMDAETKKAEKLAKDLARLEKQKTDAEEKALKEADSIMERYNSSLQDAITGSFTIYTSEQAEEQLRRLAATNGKTDESYLDLIKAATQHAYKTSPTKEAYESKFNQYIDDLGAAKERDINDVYLKMEDILTKMDEQILSTERASHQTP